ncbi:MAG: UDP-N-acetylmuramoyl-L-alanyl-D-glutamate--2,6-diaminopimelate ligase [Nitritalea sp.]
MRKLKDILYKVALRSTQGDMELGVTGIYFDSRQVRQDGLFVAVPGTQVDGHAFIAKAIELGARVIVCEVLPAETRAHVTYVQVASAAVALGEMAANFYGNPSEKLKLVGITGTNGKTSTATLLHRLFLSLGYQVGLISTVENKINEEVLPATHTTPDAVQLQALLQRMLQAGCTHVFMEASSHAIVQERMAGTHVTGAVFTNISHDHLDYHGDFNSYIKAKKKLFDGLPKTAFALTNADDKRGAVMVQNTAAQIHTYGLKTDADFKAKVLSNTLEGLELSIQQHAVWFGLIGRFNAYNLLAVLATALLLGEEEEEVLLQLSRLKSATGRFETVQAHGLTVVIDYAHTPDALENVLATLEEINDGRAHIYTVVGCGGNRDTAKRPLMAKIAAAKSTKAYFTSDNPRDEDPEQILADMQQGLSPVDLRKVLSIADRRSAIKAAILGAQEGDMILVAGKGHETYQEIKGVKYPFDDKEEVKKILALLNQK